MGSPDLKILSMYAWFYKLGVHGHVARMDTSLDITRALKVSIRGLPKAWRRPHGRPRHNTLEADLQPLNSGLNSAWKYTQDREHWKHLVETATLQLGLGRDDDDERNANQCQMLKESTSELSSPMSFHNVVTADRQQSIAKILELFSYKLTYVHARLYYILWRIWLKI